MEKNMSLSGLLKFSESWVSRFMYGNFPCRDSFKARWLADFMPVSTVLPENPGEDYPWSMVETAIGYRLRYFWGMTAAKNLQVREGLNSGTVIYALSVRPARGAEDDLFAAHQKPHALWTSVWEPYVERTIVRIKPVGRNLHADDERQLDQICFVLSGWDAIRSAGRVDEILLEASVSPNPLDRLVTAASEEVLSDLAALAARWWQAKATVPSADRPPLIHPDWDRLQQVGGARADLWLDRTLLDFCTTANPAADFDLALNRLLAKVLLDGPTQDGQTIEKIGIYWTRQGTTSLWPVGDVLHLMSGESRNIEDWRALFRRAKSSQLHS
jgi:hypothetical protein